MRGSNTSAALDGCGGGCFASGSHALQCRQEISRVFRQRDVCLTKRSQRRASAEKDKAGIDNFAVGTASCGFHSPTGYFLRRRLVLLRRNVACGESPQPSMCTPLNGVLRAWTGSSTTFSYEACPDSAISRDRRIEVNLVVAGESFSNRFDEAHYVIQAMGKHIANDVEVHVGITMHEHIAEPDGRT